MRPLLLAVLLALSPAAFAEPTAKDDTALRAEIRARLRAHRTARLIDALRLDEAGVAKLMPVLRRFDEQMEPIFMDLGDARRALKQALNVPTPDAAAVNKLVDRMMAGRAKLEKVGTERLVELRKVLTPVQFGRAVLAFAEIDRKVDKHLHQAMEQARGGGDGKGNGKGGGKGGRGKRGAVPGAGGMDLE